MEKDESRWNRWVRVSQRLRNGFQMAMVSCYTVIFTGTPVEPMDGGQSQSGGLNWLIVALPALAALGAGTGGMYFIMKRKERKMYEELAESSNAADSRRGDDGDPGTGGGV